jgi:UDP-N-acetylmuramyl pentapeptide phosphotransferase/UDP-N-acetylglucosamine-1-phosphate transferase
LGGVAIAIATIVGWIAMPASVSETGAMDLAVPTALGGGVAALVGLVDDLRTVSPQAKLAGELVAVLVPLSLLPSAHLTVPPMQVFVAAVLVIAYVNFFNFMDGSDGLASGVAVCAALGLALLAAETGANPAKWMGLTIAAAAAGFLLYNYPPASIFMGDAGSLFLGYALGMVGFALFISHVSVVSAGLVLSPFAFDAGYTLAVRATKREVLWRAHRSHLYQRLLKAGVTHRRVAVLYCTWTGLSTLLAWTWLRAPRWWHPWIGALSLLPLGLLIIYVHHCERKPLKNIG